MLGVEGGKQVFRHLSLGAVLIHTNLLGDDTPLLFHALGGEIRRVDHPQQEAEIFLKALGAGEIIGRHGVAGKSVAVGAGAGKAVHGVAVGQVKHFMLQVVGDAVGHPAGLAVEGESRVDGAEVHADKGVFLGKAPLGHHADQHAVGQTGLKIALANSGKGNIVHPCTPLRKKIVSVVRRWAARRMSSTVRAEIFSISTGRSSRGAVAAPM